MVVKNKPLPESTQTLLRFLFAVGLVGYFAWHSQIARWDKVEAIAQETCIWDLTFEWTEEWNVFFRERVRLREWIMILDSATYDVGMLYFMYYFGFTGNRVTMRMMFSNCLTGFAKMLF